MINLINKVWYRQQSLIDDMKLYSFLVNSFFILLLIIINTIMYIILGIENNFESFLMVNILSFLLSQYNMPEIQEELKLKKNITFINQAKFYKYIFYMVIKRNMLIIILLLTLMINCIVFLIVNPFKIILIIATFFTQINIILLRFSKKSEKIVFIIFTLVYIVSVWLNISLFISTILFGVNCKYIFKNFKNIFINNINVKLFNSIETSYLKKSFFAYMKTFMKRIRKSEYLDIVFTIILGSALFKYSNIKLTEYLIIFLFIAKFQLALEAKQMTYKETYMKNIFLNILGVTIKEKKKHSTEFKILFLESISVLVIIIELYFSSGNLIYSLLWGANIILLLYLNFSKVMNVYYFNIDNRYYYKGTGINVLLFYIILFITNIDVISKHFNIIITNDIIFEIIKSVLILTFMLIKFEKIFMFKKDKLKYEYEINSE